ncbi:type 2 lanthipeptide synthetase LanM [Streptomyces apocyni]|uniref:type 2 lanthipeptide synthetase LanM n=1 Tax=Streptomyces apocyni TaxID=2654677 RepID=UPI0018D19222|nr:type 2 lanthipeptide synthetase LanM [Streptomyces apocyni]
MHPQELVKRVTEERADVFGAFYTPYLTDCARQIAGYLDEAAAEAADAAGDVADAADADVDAESVVESVLRSLMGVCVETGVRTLIASFRAEGGTYEAFHARVAGAEGRGALLARFPELDRLLRLVTARTARTAREVLRALAADRRQLAELLGAEGPVTSLTTGLGDAHRGGRTVCLVGFGDGTRVVYKPQQDNCQSLLATLRTLLDEDGSFFGPLHPRSLVRSAYVWQEFIEHTDLDDVTEGAQYFRRFGRVAALLSMIGATDLHHENIIAVPQGPVVIDTETLVSLPNGPTDTSASASASASAQSPSAGAALNLDIEHSVLNTLLFPARYAGAKLDIDISGIGCVRPGASEHLTSYTVVDAGTDDIRFDRSPVVVEHGSNMAKVAGEPLDPRDWVDEISAGYGEARELLATLRDAIEAAVRASGDWAVRQVVRPTYVYARFLEASTHPVHLGSTEARAELLGKLPRYYRGAAKESADALHREEVAALLDLDVPFFTVDCDSGLLRGDLDEEMRSAADSTPREAALAAVRSFFARPPQRDLSYLRYALAGSVDDVWDVRRASRREVFPDLADATAWHSTLRDLVVGEESAPTWLLPQLRGDGLRLGGVNAPLYDGGGLLLYLAQAEALTGTSPLGVDIAQVSRAAMQPQPQPPFAGDTTPLAMSPFTGALSELVTDWEIRRRRTPDALFTHTELHPADRPLDVDSLTAADFDYLNGYGGYLVYLAAYQKHGAPELTGVPPERLLRRLVTVDGTPEEHTGELGLAHGRFGRITAMSAMVAEGLDGGSGARDHLERFAHAYVRNRWQDESLRDRASGSGWCKGYAGVAYAAGELLTALGESTGRVRTAIAPEVERLADGDLGHDISFCHGLAGRIAVLCQLADRFDWPELRDEAAALHTAFLDRYAAADGGWSCGIGTEPHLPSFFLGLSGWHYARLMLHHPQAALPRCLGGRS